MKGSKAAECPNSVDAGVSERFSVPNHLLRGFPLSTARVLMKKFDKK
jgi:hypothetical protein